MADFTRTDVAHLLRRSGFFAAPAEVDALMAKGSWAEVVDDVLDTTGNPADSIPAAVSNEALSISDRAVAMIEYWMSRMASTSTPIVERIAFFWHGILTSEVGGPSPVACHKQVQKWRALGLGDVHPLMQAMAIDPAMLIYLDNSGNRKSSPNENFARELMELFTMGNGTFTEADVIAMARAWTGHNLIYANESYLFRSDQHDYGQKTLFGITRNWDGPETITEIVRGSKQQVCARYLAGRVWSHFAYPNPAPALLDDLTAALIDAGMVVKPFLRTVFERPEFRQASTRTALVRSPVEWEIAISRATGLTIRQMGLIEVGQRIGQILYLPPNVSGWRQNRAWISSSAVWAEGMVARSVRQSLQGTGTFANLNSLAPAAAVTEVLRRFGVDDPSSATRAHLVTYLASERSAGRSSTASAGLASLVVLTPDFQLA